MLQKCQEIVDKLALFSSNEEKDDVSTGDLKYLLVSERSFVCCLEHSFLICTELCCLLHWDEFTYSRLPVFRSSLDSLSR